MYNMLIYKRNVNTKNEKITVPPKPDIQTYFYRVASLLKRKIMSNSREFVLIIRWHMGNICIVYMTVIEKDKLCKR